MQGSSGAPGRGGWVVPNATAFCASFCIMLVELVGGRLISQYLGMSLYTWTALIGVVMAGMSAGHFAGGWLADRARTRRALSGAFLLAAAACVAILPLNHLMGSLQALHGLAWPVRISLHVGLAFFVPAMALGLIIPLVAKLALEQQQASGRAVGGVFASSVAGSIAGTFATGYYLILVLAASRILLLAAGGLLALSIAYAAAAFARRELLPQPPAPAQGDSPAVLREWLPPALTVLCSNIAFMVFELAAMRVAAREFGSSLYTWTSVLGVMLAGISLGNALGGRLADRTASRAALSRVFVLAAALLLLSPACNAWMGAWHEQSAFFLRLSWPAQVLARVCAAFFLPCVALGFVSPIVVKRELQRGHASGVTVGAIYAWGAVGGILGTFLAGYLLIPALGSLPVVALMALLLAATAAAWHPKSVLSLAGAGIATAALVVSLVPADSVRAVAERLHLRYPTPAHAIYESESAYSYVAVLADEKNPDLRKMKLDKLLHSTIDVGHPTTLHYEYEWLYAVLVDQLAGPGQPVRALAIGGGGYAFPRYLELTRPGSDVVAVEIDPEVTEAARAAMGLPRDAAMSIHHMDARNLLSDLRREQIASPDFERFDFVFGDSFNDYTVPYQLTTLEFVRQVDALLEDDGVYMLNMIDLLDSGAFLGAMVQTCREVFPQVAVFDTGRATGTRDTFVIVAAKQPVDFDAIPDAVRQRYDYPGRRVPQQELDALMARNETRTLTDDFAPVENLLAPVVRARAGEPADDAYALALWHAQQGQWDEARVQGERAVAIRPVFPAAWELLSDAYARLGNQDAAVVALGRAVAGHPKPANAHYVHGLALFQTNQLEAAIAAWEQAVALDDTLGPAWYNLGVALGSKGDVPRAMDCWRKAIAADPKDEGSYYNLAAGHLMQNDIAGARQVLADMETAGLTPPADIVKQIAEAEGSPS
ncbi:MAG: tetratricopeptide repeat protein [Candidatus Hydrogenedens sp.]|nr:tetratricopeptide repeat protein [Candidatus Hydrogenedens sp.]